MPFRTKVKPYIFRRLALLVVSLFSFKMNYTTFRTKVFENEANDLLDEGLLK
jgi:hypothetical protein